MFYSPLYLLFLFAAYYNVSSSAAALVRRRLQQTPQQRPTILDTDYGPFVDDGFALGLALQAPDVFDLKMVMATSIEVKLSAMCMAEHIRLARRSGTYPREESKTRITSIISHVLLLSLLSLFQKSLWGWVHPPRMSVAQVYALSTTLSALLSRTSV
jgi:hypothetical protein